MGIFSPLQLFVENLSILTQKAEQRLNKLSTDVEAVDANLAATPTERLLANSVGLWLAGLDFWISMAPQPQLPILVIGVQGTAAAQVVENTVMIRPVSGANPPSVTNIRHSVNNAVMLAPVAGSPSFGPDRRNVTLRVTIPANPTLGRYEGVVYHDSTVLAFVLILVTP